MKLMIASDIHGSAFYCKKMIDLYKKEKVDKLLLLGDILYHGPRNDLPKEYNPKNVIAILNTMKQEIIAVKGNCDTEVDQMVLDFPIMAEYALLYINGITLFATHGHKFNKETVTNLKKSDILLNGHTHIPTYEETEKFIYMNTGSISIPKNNSQNSCIILEENTFYWKNLDGGIFDKYMI